MSFMTMQHENDPKENIKKDIGDLSTVELFNNQVLVAVYVRPEKTKSGIYLTDKLREEDKFQGKVGPVLKLGASAFDDPNSQWFAGMDRLLSLIHI